MPRFAYALADADADAARDRRATPRYRPSVVLPALLGRNDAVVVDISRSGVRLYNFSIVKRGEILRFTMVHGDVALRAPVRVLASSVVALGSGVDGAPTYETRVEFFAMSAQEAASVNELLAKLLEVQAQRWMNDARGIHVAEEPLRRIGIYFVRLQRSCGFWHEVATRSPRQPENGITIPADTPPTERKMIRELYDRADAAGRQLLQSISAAACESLTCAAV